MAPQEKLLIAQNPIVLRCHRLMEAFSKSDDERDFYIDRQEGFLLYFDLDKPEEQIEAFERELEVSDRFIEIPKLTFYEIKKIMEGFVNEKVYDIDTKEKLLDIIQAKEARENFLEFMYDHDSELEKWQQYYQERFRVRIIEWLRKHKFDFVFEEDLELTKSMLEKIKLNTFNAKVSKDIAAARKILVSKAKSYYSNEALNPRPKRGRPPKQVAKVEIEPQFANDIYTTVLKPIQPFLFVPEYSGGSLILTFSSKFTSEEDFGAYKKQQVFETSESKTLAEKLSAIRALSSSWSLSQSDLVKEAHSLINQHRPASSIAQREALQERLAQKENLVGKKAKADKKVKESVKATSEEKKSSSKTKAKSTEKKAAKSEKEKPKEKKTKTTALRKLRRSKKKEV